jgi:hypothetical protein
MADTLFLSLWFPDFDEEQVFSLTLNVLRQFPFSAQQPGVTYVSVHPVSWNEATVFEQRYRPGVLPEVALEATREFLHDDYAYVFEVAWDLWAPDEAQAGWTLQPRTVRLIVEGVDFDEGAAEQEGHVQFDFGLDTPFLYEDLKLTFETEQRVKSNIQKLVELTSAMEKNTGINSRVLWSESGDNLAQKLISRLQQVQ